MASGLFSLSGSLSSFFPAPVAFLTQLTISSAAVGLTPAYSFIRLASLPLISACVYSILHVAKLQMRPRWASLIGGASFMFLLQYLDLALVNQWNSDDLGPVLPKDHAMREKYEKREGSNEIHATNDSVWSKFCWAWSSMFALRHVNTKYEARNTPVFKDSDPSFVPSKGAFLIRESTIALICYLLLDLMSQRPPSPNAPQLFDEALIPVFRRLSEVTLPQLRLRALSIAGFAVTFWALIRGYSAAAGVVTVALGVNEPRDWRPQFGSLKLAYSLRNFWGKVWHQNLRSLLTGPAAKITYDVLHLSRGSVPARLCSLFITFFLSGVMHSCAGIAAGMSPKQLNVVHFFVTQALGIVVEDFVSLAFSKMMGQKDKKKKTGPPSLAQRLIGYLWVAAFMTWSGPVWLYPQASRPVLPGTNSSFLPYSIIRAWKMGDLRAG
ncbi:4e9caf82-547c-4e00-923f-874d61be0b17 [Sclerotinia trifoliorum]|uniref:4e9caf82-547c-4e00-923f-874d61be0b17 n=1 Tax=Sclerotinia trifoliorum TaxID=28548 RepID=A0A8H2VWF0_9HELO|nr:4e9caf82-547c-4e00-923f-874d61be0b17 [Sclerotinia trifoliorum]